MPLSLSSVCILLCLPLERQSNDAALDCTDVSPVLALLRILGLNVSNKNTNTYLHCIRTNYKYIICIP